MPTAGMVTGAGDAGLDDFAGAEAGMVPVLDGRGSMRTGAGVFDIDLASRIPPPDVTNGFSAVFFRQNDHFGFASSPCGVVWAGSASGSPSRDRLVQLSRLSCRLSF
jgi:hypothetical protein